MALPLAEGLKQMIDPLIDPLKVMFQTFKPSELKDPNYKLKINMITYYMMTMNTFIINQLNEKINEETHKLKLNITINKKDIKEIIDRFLNKGILSNNNGEYELKKVYKYFFGEFFSHAHITTERVGLLRYILSSERRQLLWAIINIDNVRFNKGDISKVIGDVRDDDKNKKFKLLTRLCKKYGIEETDEEFIITNNKDEVYKKILEDILTDYYYWKLSKTRGLIKELIFGLMICRKEISGKEIVKELKLNGYKFDKSLVYYHLRKLKKEGFIETVRTANTRGREEYYRLKVDFINITKEELEDKLKLLFNYAGIKNEKYERFIKEVSKRYGNDPYYLFELYTFCNQFDILRYNISLELWKLLIDCLGNELYNVETIISEILNYLKTKKQ